MNHTTPTPTPAPETHPITPRTRSALGPHCAHGFDPIRRRRPISVHATTSSPPSATSSAPVVASSETTNLLPLCNTTDPVIPMFKPKPLAPVPTPQLLDRPAAVGRDTGRSARAILSQPHLVCPDHCLQPDQVSVSHAAPRATLRCDFALPCNRICLVDCCKNLQSALEGERPAHPSAGRPSAVQGWCAA